MKSAVIIFPGSNCERDAVDALQKINSKIDLVWHQESHLADDYDLIIVPGGFSYGDYLRSGAMASISSVIAEVKRHAKRGVKVLGICNGFQILTECGLLDGVLMRNESGKFICKNLKIKVENPNTDFTKMCKEDDILSIPIAHMDGRFYAENDKLKAIEDGGLVAFRYCDDNGVINIKSNLNGSLNNIAGIFNFQKNVLGMMPHPERAIDLKTGSVDGLKIFESLLNSIM